MLTYCIHVFFLELKVRVEASMMCYFVVLTFSCCDIGVYLILSVIKMSHLNFFASISTLWIVTISVEGSVTSSLLLDHYDSFHGL